MNNPHQAQTHSPGKMFAGKKRTLVFALFCAIFCFSLAVCAAEEKPLLLTGGVQDNGPAPAARMPVAAPEISAEAGNFLEALQNANRAVAAAVLPSATFSLTDCSLSFFELYWLVKVPVNVPPVSPVTLYVTFAGLPVYV